MKDQLEYQASSSGSTQNGRILSLLQSRVGEWFSLMELYQVSRSMAVHSRIHDLRKAGHRIEHQNKWENRHCHSFYRLLPATALDQPTQLSNE
ncbi:MAG: helix-turn-helix domain-containing protein [Verrucomicrobiota bacterium]|nr:helix-turn-helix domain-containing protein [Verrucomicrobiota bacterium]